MWRADSAGYDRLRPKLSHFEPPKTESARRSTILPRPMVSPAPGLIAPTTRSVLGVLPKARLVELGRDVGVTLPPAAAKDEHAESLIKAGLVSFQRLMRTLGREELRAACRQHGLSDVGRARSLLAARLLEAHGAADSMPPRPIFRAHEVPRYAPREGDIVQVRHRQWLVEEVAAPPADGHATRVRMVCLEDDNQGRVLEVLWELELGAKVLAPEAHGLGAGTAIDEPRRFGACLHALKWSAVTATDAKLFQSPFRAGIKLMNHQLTPLTNSQTRNTLASPPAPPRRAPRRRGRLPELRLTRHRPGLPGRVAGGGRKAEPERAA